ERRRDWGRARLHSPLAARSAEPPPRRSDTQFDAIDLSRCLSQDSGRHEANELTAVTDLAGQRHRAEERERQHGAHACEEPAAAYRRRHQTTVPLRITAKGRKTSTARKICCI